MSVQAAEEKQRRKDEKKAAKASVAEGSDAEDDGSDTGSGFDGVQAILAARAMADGDAPMTEAREEEEVEEDVPVLINPDLPNLKAVLEAADVVVEVLDARDPAAGRSAHLEEVASGLGKKVVLVLCGFSVDSPVGRALGNVGLLEMDGVELFETFSDAVECMGHQPL